MAHRGRLNVLAHVVGRPYEVILREFEGERTIEAVVSSDEGGTGDVKYHLGAEGTRATRAGDMPTYLPTFHSDSLTLTAAGSWRVWSAGAAASVTAANMSPAAICNGVACVGCICDVPQARV